jgi:hypothetical protein
MLEQLSEQRPQQLPKQLLQQLPEPQPFYKLKDNLGITRRGSLLATPPKIIYIANC